VGGASLQLVSVRGSGLGTTHSVRWRLSGALLTSELYSL